MNPTLEPGSSQASAGQARRKLRSNQRDFGGAGFAKLASVDCRSVEGHAPPARVPGWRVDGDDNR